MNLTKRAILERLSAQQAASVLLSGQTLDEVNWKALALAGGLALGAHAAEPQGPLPSTGDKKWSQMTAQERQTWKDYWRESPPPRTEPKKAEGHWVRGKPQAADLSTLKWASMSEKERQLWKDHWAEQEAAAKEQRGKATQGGIQIWPPKPGAEKEPSRGIQVWPPPAPEK